MFNQIGQAKYDITVAGEIALVLLCGGEKDEGLDVLLYRRTVIIFLKAHRMWNKVLCNHQRLKCRPTTAFECTIM